MVKLLNIKFKAGVIAGTPFDTNLGCKHLNRHHIETIPHPISATPKDQTLLQIQPNKLFEEVLYAFRTLEKSHVSCIFIYCNSLSLALQAIDLQEYTTLPIITPLSFYESIALQHRHLGIMTANAQSLAALEKLLLKHNPHYTIVGISHLPLVCAIEKASCPDKLIDQYHLIEKCQHLYAQGIQSLLLACTHFNFFTSALNNKLNDVAPIFSLIDPTEMMISAVLALKNQYLFPHAPLETRSLKVLSH